jgi:hypothetical protein
VVLGHLVVEAEQLRAVAEQRGSVAHAREVARQPGRNHLVVEAARQLDALHNRH